MIEPPSPRPVADRNLLFGILALQLDFIGRDALIKAMNAWVLEKTKPLGQILVEQKALPRDQRDLLDALVKEHLKCHDNDPEKSLAAVSSVGSVREDLKQIADPDLQVSLTQVSRAHPAGEDPYATRVSTVGTPTSSGVRFQVLRPHSKGGLGEVFVARDQELQREVALKQIQDRFADNPESRSRFLLEAEITGGLEHPGIVPVYGLGQYADGRPYYAMRFIKGDSLKDAIDRFHRADTPGRDPGQRTLEFRELLGRFIDVCNAIAFAHSRRVLHRDLKPGNIMLGKYGETLVVDWGLAKPLRGTEHATSSEEPPLQPSTASDTSVTSPGSAIGTPQYMSPEQAAGRLDLLGPASDIYSLGATLYSLLTGKPPFGDRELGTILQKVQRGDFPPPRQVKRGVPVALEAVCLAAMALLPEKRYATPRDLANDVEHWLADEPVEAYPEPMLVRLSRWGRRHRTVVAAVAVLLFTALVTLTLSYILLSREHGRTLQAQKDRVLSQVDVVMDANPQAVPSLIHDLEPFRQWADPSLREMRARSDLSEKRRVRASLALLPIDPGEASYLGEQMLNAEPQEMLLIRDALTPYRTGLISPLWSGMEAGTDPGRQFRCAVVLASWDPDSPRWTAAGDRIIDPFLAANPLHLGLWIDALRPVRQALLGPLARVFREGPQSARSEVAANILADYARDRPDVLADLIPDADDRQYALLLPLLKGHRDQTIALLEHLLRQDIPPEDQSSARDALARRQAQAAVVLLQLGQLEPVWPLMRHSPDPTRRTYLVHALGRLGSSPDVLIHRLDTEPDVSGRRALILSLGEFSGEQLPDPQRASLVQKLLRLYQEDGDPGIHGAIDWLLRHGQQGHAPRKLDWQQGSALRKIDHDLAGQVPGERRWYVSRTGQTLAIIPGPMDFQMGSPAREANRIPLSEDRHHIAIPRSFALATRELTVEHALPFVSAMGGKSGSFIQFPGYMVLKMRFKDPMEAPVQGFTWLESAAFCRWLSEQEGVPEDQQCFPPLDQIKPGMKLPSDYLQRTGYRLPTEAEWEYACRAGAVTSRYFGSSDQMLGQYSWSVLNSDNRAWPSGQLKPNDLGLFDMNGNVWEFCLDQYHALSPPVLKSEDRGYLSELTDGMEFVERGGSFGNHPAWLRSANRDGDTITYRYYSVGLRVARTYPGTVPNPKDYPAGPR